MKKNLTLRVDLNSGALTSDAVFFSGYELRGAMLSIIKSKIDFLIGQFLPHHSFIISIK
jgi:hypothetical protein